MSARSNSSYRFITGLLLFLLGATLCNAVYAVLPGTQTRVEYTANGATAVFAFTFKTLDAAHVEVFLNGVKQVSGYSTYLNPAQDTTPGGSITFTPAPVAGTEVRIQRTLPIVQDTVYSPYTPFPAKTTERTLDKLAMVAQQLDRGVTDSAIRDDEQDVQIALGPGASNGDNIPVTATGTTTARTLKDRFTGTVDVRDFGAMCDDATDDLTAFNAAAAFLTNGGILTGPARTCRVVGTITLLSKTTIRAPGLVIRQAANNTPTLKATSKTDITLDGIELVGVGSGDTASTANAHSYGSNARAYGFWCDTCSRVTVKNVVIRNHRNAGVVTFNSNDVWISGSRIVGTRGSGSSSADAGIPDENSNYQQFAVWLYSSGTGSNGINFVVDGNYLGETHHGVYVGPGLSRVFVSRNTMNYLGQHGMYVVPYEFVSVSGNSITAKLDAVKMQGQHSASQVNPSKITIQGNTLVGGPAPTVSVWALDEVSGSTPVRASTYLDGVVISGNVILSTGHAGIIASSVRNLKVSGNIFSSTVRSGVHTWASSGSVSDNIFISTGSTSYDPVYIVAAPHLLMRVAGNTIQGTNSGTPNAYMTAVWSSPLSEPIAWVTGKYHGQGVYVQNSGNVYVSVNSGVTGATPPTHGGGVVSDGTVSWSYVSSVAGVDRGTVDFTANVVNVTGSEPAYSFYLGSTNVILRANNLRYTSQLIFTSGVVTLYDDGSNVHAGWNSGSPYAAGPLPGRPKRDFMGTAAPVSGTYQFGDRVWSTSPSPGTPTFWLATAGGTPGTWVSQIPATTVGSITLTSGTPSTGTATVAANAKCVCTNATTQANPIKCAVSGSTLTATGPNTVTDSVTYACF